MMIWNQCILIKGYIWVACILRIDMPKQLSNGDLWKRGLGVHENNLQNVLRLDWNENCNICYLPLWNMWHRLLSYCISGHWNLRNKESHLNRYSRSCLTNTSWPCVFVLNLYTDQRRDTAMGNKNRSYWLTIFCKILVKWLLGKIR